MDMNLIEGGIIAAVVLMSVISAFSTPKQQGPFVTKEKEEEAIDPGNLGPASETGEEGVVEETKEKEPSMIQVGIAKLNIQKNAAGLVEYIHDIPISLIPNGTIGTMQNTIRELCVNGGRKMSRALSFDLASKVKALRESGKAVQPEEEAANDSKGKTDINAA